MLAVPYSLSPPPVPDPVLNEFRRQLAAGVAYYREPAPDTRDDPAVYSVGVVRRRPGLYRAVVLYARPSADGCYLHACESSREAVTRWLAEHGLPTIRLIRADF